MTAVDWLLKVVKDNKKRTFLVDASNGKKTTYQEMHEWAIRIAADLKDRGIKQGDRVAFLLNNSPEFAKLYLGCLYLGAVTVPVNPILAAPEINFILKHSGAKILFLSEETVGKVDLVSVAKNKTLRILMIESSKGKKPPKRGMHRWNISSIKKVHDFKPFQGVCDESPMTIIYTSGTTSTPSGVIHCIGSMIQNARNFNQRLGIGGRNRFYNILAMSYLGGYYNLLMLPYTAGASVVLSKAFDAGSALFFWETAKKYEVNTLWYVPTIMSILLEMDRGSVGEQYSRKKIDLALVGTAPLSDSLRKQFEAKYGSLLYENYGLSETFFITTNAPSTTLVDGSVGQLLPGVQLTIHDQDGHPLEYGEEGEICVLTPYLMQGYYNPKTKKAYSLNRQNWFHTGDIGYIKPTGELFITGRKKDLIIRGGINISPASIEDVISKNVAVKECAVVGIPHAHYGEDIAVVVCLKKGADLKRVRTELMKDCKKKLGSMKQPSKILEMEQIPKSSTGKIQKNKIRDLLIQKLGLVHLKKTQQRPLSDGPRKQLMLPGRIRKKVSRPENSLIAELSQYPTSIISDCLNRLGVMHSAIRPLSAGHPFCGPAITVEEVEGGNLMSHAALELTEPGDVLVIDAKGAMTRSCWGGVQTLMAKERGIAGVVINGTVRDMDDIKKMDLAVYALGISAGGPLKGWGGNVNYPIACAGVVVNAGDIIAGDDDGVVVIPRVLAGQVPPLCELRKKMEEKWIELVKSGEPTLDVVNLRSKLRDHGIQYE